MPIYNNPAIGQAVSNLTGLFAPPSGQDAAAWAMANERNAKAKRDAQAFAAMTAPGAAQSLIDQFGVASGTFSPTQSYRAVDVESGDRRYGADRSFEASRLNNADDNARAIATNAATVAGDVRKQQLQSLAGWFAPVAQDAVRPAVPSDIAHLYGAPGALPEVHGNRSPLSETEVKGGERQDLRARGLLTDQDMLDAITGDRTPVEAIGPDGRTPMYMTPGEAVRTGAQPAPRSPSTVINNSTGSDSGKFYEEADKARGKSFNDVADAGATARRSLIQIDELDRTLADVGTGGLAAIKAFAGSYGLPVGDLSDIQAASALINQLVPAQRTPGSGTMSDGDVALFKQSLPRIVNQPGGNSLIIRTVRGIAQYDAQRGDIANRVLDREITPAEGRRMMAELPNPLASFKQKTGENGNASLPGASAPPDRSAAAPVRVKTPAEAARLPSGTRITLPDGSEGKVP